MGLERYAQQIKTMKNFTDKTTLTKYLENLKHKPILLVIPAISLGTPGLNNQYKDYLDQSASLYKHLTENNFNVSIFALGAEHRGDGFLHQIGKDYLMEMYNIPNEAFVWNDENFKKVGLCSVEEAELLKQFLTEARKNFIILTCVSLTQSTRYLLHQQGYGIKSLYYVFPDKPNYYHLQGLQREKILISITKTDPTWESEIGKRLRKSAHSMRDPKEAEITQKEIREMDDWLSRISL